jgi:AraC-like DNA-binding protein
MSSGPTPEPAVAHQRELLFRSEDMAVVDFRCREHVAKQGPEEPNPTNSVAFVRRGVFQRTDEGRTVIADANHILFFNAAQPYRYSHPFGGGDDCTILTMSTSLALQVVGERVPRDAERDTAPFSLGYAVSSSSTARLLYELLHALRNRATTLAVEDLLSELSDEAVRDAYDTHGRRTEQIKLSPAARARRREMTEAAKLTINRRLSAPPSLNGLAHALGCSPFHLSRAFHSTAGVSLRRYLSRLRAGIAAYHLARGASDLTDLALALGYSDHSHFTNAFREEFGMPPSHFRAKHRGK